jgi:saccharopine dehydrogenase-like NADP-dependent oxidoreductase
MSYGGITLKILVVGTGNIGSIIARDLAESLPSIEVEIADKDQSRAEKVAASVGRKNVTGIQLDVFDNKNLIATLGKSDLIVGALPGEIGHRLLKACIDAGRNMVDVSFMPEDPLELSKAAAKSGVTIIPDCGVAPGLSHMLLQRGICRLDKVRNAVIMVGGLPEKPIPPLGYTITWSVEGLIDEYTRKARIVKNGKVTEVNALDQVEEIEFPGVGKLEAFYSDGLRTLLSTIKGVENMSEKTLRYPGHIEKIRLLRDLGFLDETPIEFEKTTIAPRKMTVGLLEKKLKKPEVPDILAMLVQVEGTKSGKRMAYVYCILDHYDQKNKVTAMARTTAYTASCVTQLLAKKVIKGKGMIPPEKLGEDEGVFVKLLNMLKKRGVLVKESKKTLK